MAARHNRRAEKNPLCLDRLHGICYKNICRIYKRGVRRAPPLCLTVRIQIQRRERMESEVFERIRDYLADQLDIDPEKIAP